MNVESMSFKKKIVSNFMLLIFLFIVVLGFLLNSQNRLGALQDDGAARFKDTDKISQVLIDVGDVYSVVADAEINHNMVETKKSLVEVKEKMKLNIATIKQIADTEAEKKWASELETAYGKYVGTFESEMLPRLEKEDKITDEIRALDDKIDGLRKNTQKPLNDFYKSIHDESIVADQVFDETFRSGIKYSVVGAILVTIVALVMAFYTSSKISSVLVNVKSELVKTYQKIMESSEKVAKAAEHLSGSTNEQASAIQETSASMEEMNSMIKKTAASASDSNRLSEMSAQNALKGKETSEQLMRSVSDIDENNKKIMEAVENGNNRISEIVDVINEISIKTKVINDIVFQTKLLSFNASVEAARAGEQGKGFAVVAEEVGNLAQMSGKAAMEISAMLDDSTQKVKEVIEGTQKNVGAILVKGNEVVRQGLSVADETSKILNIIDGDVKVVNANISEISVASDEQAKGVEQVAQALHQLDQATQMNSNLSQELYGYSKELSVQTVNLKEAMEQLHRLVEGANQA